MSFRDETRAMTADILEQLGETVTYRSRTDGHTSRDASTLRRAKTYTDYSVTGLIDEQPQSRIPVGPRAAVRRGYTIIFNRHGADFTPKIGDVVRRDPGESYQQDAEVVQVSLTANDSQYLLRCEYTGNAQGPTSPPESNPTPG